MEMYSYDYCTCEQCGCDILREDLHTYKKQCMCSGCIEAGIFEGEINPDLVGLPESINYQPELVEDDLA